VTTLLADGNVLVALTVADHVHHDRAVDWFQRGAPHLATCPITEGTLLRFLIRSGIATADAIAVLDAVRANDWHVFWPDAMPYAVEHLRGVVGHRQVTDAYLVALAKRHRARVATLDRGLVALYGRDSLLVE